MGHNLLFTAIYTFQTQQAMVRCLDGLLCSGIVHTEPRQNQSMAAWFCHMFLKQT